MKADRGFWLVLLLGLYVSLVGNASAQDMALARNNGSPVADARPGEYFFMEGVKAVRANDYRHAVYEYKIAASWGYKMAQYNLGVIFANGEGGINHDMPQGLAWMMLAAERDDGSNSHQFFVKGREKVEKACEDYEIEQAKVLFKEMSKTYADEHALPRAKLQWNNVRMNVTGSHVGGIGNLQVSGSNARSAGGKSGKYEGGRAPAGVATAGDLTGGTGTDGSIAYRELRDTDNPYDASWDIGTVTVGNVETVEAAGRAAKNPPAEPKKP